jgi:DNA-binding transcriptional regulator YdaS (Cro superfamily)
MQDQKLPNITYQAVMAAGGPTHVAESLDLTPSGVSQWYHNNVPANRVIELCRLTRGVFQPHQIRPDVFGPEVRV